MDTSALNITMCEKAEELQKLWKPQVGDWFYKRDGIGFGLWLICKIEEGVLLCSGERMGKPPFNGQFVEFRVPEMYIWLPRQDQLQEMIGDDPYSNIKNAMWSILDDLHKYAFTPNIFNEFIPTSMEQLWLGFVMEEVYQKVWDGGDWIGVKQRSEGRESERHPC